jgi:predicted nuclease of predicted toxin-antitoxin system
MTRSHHFLVDAQLPPALCGWLVSKGYLATHVTMWRSGDVPDTDIAAHCAEDGLILVSKDEDFCIHVQLLDFRLIWLRIGNAPNKNLFNWLEPRWKQIDSLLEKGERLIEVN